MGFGDIHVFDDLAERIFAGTVDPWAAALYIVLIDSTRLATTSDENPVLADYTTSRAPDAPRVTIDTGKMKSIRVEILPSTEPKTYEYVLVKDIRSYIGDARIQLAKYFSSTDDLGRIVARSVDWARIPGMTNVAQALIFDSVAEGDPCLFFVDLIDNGTPHDLDLTPLQIVLNPLVTAEGA